MRETIIIISILIMIFGGAIFTKNFLNKTSDEIISKLDELKEDIVIAKKTNNREEAIKLSNDIYDKWEKMDKTWSILILHDELDTIKISITKMRAQIQEGELEESLEELETTKFLINHIKETEKFKLENIF